MLYNPKKDKQEHPNYTFMLILFVPWNFPETLL